MTYSCFFHLVCSIWFHRVQLAVCVSSIVKHDFPGKWTQIVDKVSIYLQNPDATPWFGALLCLYQLVKNYEYKNENERGQLNDAMLLLLPQVYNLCTRLLPDPSEHSTLLQKQILKIFFAFTQYTLPVPKVCFGCITKPAITFIMDNSIILTNI